MSDRVPFRVIEITAPPPRQTRFCLLQALRYVSVRVAVSALLLLPIFCVIGLSR